VLLETVKRHREKRAERRYQVRWKLQGRGLSFMGFRQGDEEALNGRVLNINRGGLCLLTEQPIEKSAVLQCEILSHSTRMLGFFHPYPLSPRAP